ncbi:hypothetical protein [Saccharospirillum salsuginis]|uniref:Uncharacterized protein n=1 Tax=Saccharospirillum salsuginis TaxID=418750 RepID=A0A918K5Q2_9GAMM|nr:hypothetical protein [Saccharospirillum salsuginis]GGX49409.1 hypothetical protein GCM10007392_15900 [Saccharospirillum salsuginis]
MSAARYHLVCEGFRSASVNKTQLSFALKQQLKLDDAQLADLMASRRTILARNLNEEKARALGRKLSRAGLMVKAETVAANQKISPEELRHHLLDGGLSHYFAGRYHHPDEELDTRLSLALLAGVPALCYVLLPLIALMLALPLLSLSVWLEQTVAAAVQGLIAAALLVPAWLLRPVREPADGVKLEADTEHLIYTLCDEISHYLDAPSVVTLRVSEAPLIRMHQSLPQWLRGQCELELGLPFLEATTLQQTAGEIAYQLGALAPRGYHWQWGLFQFAHRALTRRVPRLRDPLAGWIKPMLEYQEQRQHTMVDALIGRQVAQQLQRLRSQLGPLEANWSQFQQFCEHLAIQPTAWSDWLRAAPPSNSDAEEDSPGLFRISAPATWALSNASGYRKALNRDSARSFTTPALSAWKQFQTVQRAKHRLTGDAFPASALMPPTGSAPATRFRPSQLKQRYRATLKNQEAAIRHALGLNKKAPKQDLNHLSRQWREAASAYWDESALRHRSLPLAKAVYLALNNAEQMTLWARQTVETESEPARIRDRQLMALYHRWLNALKPIPALPLLAAPGRSLSDQLLRGATAQDSVTAATIAQHCDYWVNSLQIYWTLVAASLLNSQTDTETGQAAA